MAITYTVGYRKYSPLFRMLASGTQNRGLYARLWYFRVTTITNRRSPPGHAIPAFLLALAIGLNIHIDFIARVGLKEGWLNINTCAGTFAETGRGAYMREGVYSRDTTVLYIQFSDSQKDNRTQLYWKKVPQDQHLVKNSVLVKVHNTCNILTK